LMQRGRWLLKRRRRRPGARERKDEQMVIRTSVCGACGFSMILCATLLCAVSGCSRQETSVAPASELGGSLFVYCAAGMGPPVGKLAEEFGRGRGVEMEISYAGSNVLLGQIELTRKGDVYIAGDADYVDMAEKKGLVKSKKRICYFVPVIMVAKGNPKGVKTLGDLTKEGVKIGQGDEKAAAGGRLMPKLLELNGVDAAAWQKNVVLSTPTVNELALKIELGTIDAAVVWRSIALQYPKVSDIVSIDRAKNVCPEVAGAVLSDAVNPAAAAAFLDLLASERGRTVLAENGYTVEKP